MKQPAWMKAMLAVLAVVIVAGSFWVGRISVDPESEEVRAELRDTQLEMDRRVEEAGLLRLELEEAEQLQEELQAKEEEIEALNERIEELEAKLAELESDLAEKEEKESESESETATEDISSDDNSGSSTNASADLSGSGSGSGTESETETESGTETETVSSNERPKSGERAVYLTFDDGPTDLTPDILSILNDYDVPGNFFLIGQRMESRPDLVRAMDNAGHGIYSHTYSHDYAIYKSFDTYYEDLKKMESAYERVLGKAAPPLVRFPGGSSNHSSIEYSGENFMVELAADIQERGYDYIDWNVTSGDASAIYNDPKAMFERIVDQSQGKDIIVPLFHDTERNQATRDILPDVIEHYQSQGYSFYTLDNLTASEISRMENNRILNRSVVR